MSFVERCRQRHLGSEGGDEGFTLIELLVVLLIIGILLAIAIPTFLSVTKGANNTAAQSNLQTALTGAKTYYTNSNQTFTGLTNTAATGTSSIQSIDTGLNYASGASSTGPHVVSTAVSGGGTVVTLAAFANGTNDCWVIIDQTNSSPQTVNGFTNIATGTWFGVVLNTTTAICNASTLSVGAANQSNTGFPHG